MAALDKLDTFIPINNNQNNNTKQSPRTVVGRITPNGNNRNTSNAESTNATNAESTNATNAESTNATNAESTNETNAESTRDRRVVLKKSNKNKEKSRFRNESRGFHMVQERTNGKLNSIGNNLPRGPSIFPTKKSNIMVFGKKGNINGIYTIDGNFTMKNRKEIIDNARIRAIERRENVIRKKLREPIRLIREGERLIIEGERLIIEGKRLKNDGKIKEGKQSIKKGKQSIKKGNQLINEGIELMNEKK